MSRLGRRGMSKPLRYISVCSGIEAASVAWEPLGWQALAFAEIEPFPCAVLAHHWPTVPNLGDLTKWREWPAELLVQADVLIGGTPCQSFSVAGLRAGLDDARGNLSLEFVRLANAIDDLRRAAGRKPAYILWENVPGVLSDSTNGFGAMLGGLAGSAAAIAHPSGASWPDAGVVAGPTRAVGWRCLDAQHFGLAQRRKRVFVLARGGAGDWSGPDALLPIGESVRGDRAQGSASRQDIAGCLSPGAHPGGANGQDAYTNQLVVAPLRTRRPGESGLCGEESGPVVQPKLSATVTSKWAKGSGGPAGDECQNLVLAPQSFTVSSHAQYTAGVGSLRSSGGDLGGGSETLVVTAFDPNQVTSRTNKSNPQPGDPCHTLPAAAVAPLIVQSVALRGREGGNMPELSDLAPEVRTPGGGSSAAMVLCFGAQMSTPHYQTDIADTLQAKNPKAVAIRTAQTSSNGHGFADDIAHTLDGANGQAVASGVIRRLLPIETERLQGFPDDHI